MSLPEYFSVRPFSDRGPVPKPLEERIWEKVRKTENCWLWTGALMQNGYAAVRVRWPSKKDLYVHRLVWELSNNTALSPGLCVCHRCDVRHCCNPDHLFAASQAANLADMASKGRSTRGERNPNSKLSAADVVLLRSLESTHTVEQLSCQFGICRDQVKRVLRREHWKHL
jgi:hypothetical protein